MWRTLVVIANKTKSLDIGAMKMQEWKQIPQLNL